MLSDELALAYDRHEFRYLAGLKTDKNIHKKLLTMFSFPVFEKLPLTDDGEYFGRVCQVPFEHNGKKGHPSRVGRAEYAHQKRLARDQKKGVFGIGDRVDSTQSQSWTAALSYQKEINRFNQRSTKKIFCE